MWTRFQSWLTGLLRRDRIERDLSRELEFHLAARTEDLVRQGFSAQDAARKARLEFGSAERYKEEARESRGLRVLDELRADLRYAARGLRRSRGFTAVVVLSLALGIGINTAMFSVVNTVLLRPLPFEQSDRLVVISEELREPYRPGMRFPPMVDFFAERDRLQSFESVMGVGSAFYSYHVIGLDEPEELTAGPASASMCAMFRVQPVIGRCFTPDEEAQEAKLALLSDEFWRRKFAGDPGVLGKTMSFRDEPKNEIFTIVGVMPPNFRVYPTTTKRDLWVPVPPRSAFGWNQVIGRLKPGVDIRQALAEAQTVQRQVLPKEHEGAGGRRIFVRPLLDQVGKGVKSGLAMLLAAVALLLLITCANVANLLLSRGAGRAREIAVREALGAGCFRVCRQLLTEALVLTSLGGCTGLLAANWIVKGVQAVAFEWLPRMDELHMDWRVFGFTAVLTALSGLLCGLLPALRLSRMDLADAMKASGGGAIGGRRQHAAMNALVVFQTAVCVVVMMGAGLLINTIVRLKNIDLGIRPDHLAFVRIVAPKSAGAVAFITEVLDRVRSIPGVQAAGTINMIPPGSGTISQDFRLPGTPAGSYPLEANHTVASPGYFEAMGIPLLRGRPFDGKDQPNTSLVAVISDSMARRYWPGADPVGQTIVLEGRNGERAFQVIGVAGDVRQTGLKEQPDEHIYTTFAQGSSIGTTLVVRTQGDPVTIAAALKQEIRVVDKNQTLQDFKTMDQELAGAIQEPRFYMILLTTFGGLALVLTTLGVGGLIAYAVSRRTQEIGLRISFGAAPSDLLGMFASGTLKLVAMGILLGAAGSWAVTRFTKTLLYEITPTDPMTFAIVTAVLLGVALAACCASAFRATTIDPTIVLRHD